MNQQEVLDQVNTIFRNVFENENLEINMETTADHVEEWDSLNHTMMIVEIEKHFNLKFKLKEVLSFQNVGDMVNTIVARLAI
ncbi:MAG: acyl carrier protein [Bacteroidetes bacterium]|nr:acyl carrier protein [Bacteroidota bacterium]